MKTVRVFKYGRTSIPVTEETPDAVQDKQGRWYFEGERPRMVRIFLGTYGFGGNGHFCGIHCGYTWAVCACAMRAVIGGSE